MEDVKGSTGFLFTVSFFLILNPSWKDYIVICCVTREAE